MYLAPNSLTFYLVTWLVVAASLFVTSRVIPGFRLRSFGSALIAALVLGIANMLIRPLIAFLALPLTILTFGLFVFVVNAVVLRLTAATLKDFEIDGWLSAILGAIFFAVVQSCFYWLLR